jgi:hypothetical protein
MTDLLESDLSEAFASRAATVPTDVAARLSGIDYHPRTGRVSPRVKVGSLAGIAAATGTAVSIIVLGGAQPAFAGWSATPVASTSGPSSAAVSGCQAQLGNQTSRDVPSGGSWTPAVTDVRGPYTVVIYENGSARATCFSGPSFTVVSTHSTSDGGAQQIQNSAVRSTAGSGVGQTSVSGGAFVGTGSDAISFMTVSHLDLNAASGGDYTLVEGQTAPDVTGVSLVRSDGSDVVATTGGNTFVAWWPGSQDVTSALVTTPSGQMSQSITLTKDFAHNSTPPTPIGGTCTTSPASPSSSSQSVQCLGGSAGAGPTAP